MPLPEPPPGWYVFGTHAGLDKVPPMEFSEELGEEDLLPLWERPVRCEKSDLFVRDCAGPECRNDVAWFEVDA